MVEISKEVQTLDAFRTRLLRLHGEMLDLFHSLDPVIKDRTLDNPNQADLGWQFRELANLFDEWRKEANARQDLIGKILAFSITTKINEEIASLGEPGNIDTKVKGNFCTATPDVKQQGRFPKRNTPQYKALCEYLGIPESVVDRGIVTFHYNEMANFLTELASDSKDPPPGIFDMYPVYKTIYYTKNRKQKGNEDDGNEEE